MHRNALIGLLSSALLMSAAALAGAGELDPMGKPADAKAGAVERYSLWHDGKGWHLATTTKEKEHHFRGHIAVKNGELVNVHGSRLEKKGPQADNFVVGPEKRTVNFDFSTKGHIDILDWEVKGKDAMLSFTLEIGEKDPSFQADRIFVGKEGEHPTANGFELPAHPTPAAKAAK
jgi:hypothetical protein